MDEPMDDNKLPAKEEFLPDHEYKSQYWAKLSSAVSQLLETPANGYVPISYEQTYSCVYKSVCHKYSERLYNDLTSHITCFLEHFNSELCSCISDSSGYITKFGEFLKRYLDAIASIVPIFNYMNKFYVQTKLKSDLDTELRQLFITVVADKHIDQVLGILSDALHRPFTICPSIMSGIIKNLHFINSDYATLKPQLFAKYVPNILPVSRVCQLDVLIRETQAFQESLHGDPLFDRHELSRKRPFEDDQPTCSGLSSLCEYMTGDT